MNNIELLHPFNMFELSMINCHFEDNFDQFRLLSRYKNRYKNRELNRESH